MFNKLTQYTKVTNTIAAEAWNTCMYANEVRRYGIKLDGMNTVSD